MIVRDEEKYLPECLESVKGFADEIVVVDTGSTDKTIEIAESYGAKVYHYEWNDNFSDARNKSIDMATCDWIFILDADERLDEQSKSVIRQGIDEGKYDIFSIFQSSRCRDYSDVETNYYNSETIRIWRKCPSIRYEGRVHEAISNNGDVNVDGATINAVIYHEGYLPEIIEQRHKDERNIKLMQIELDNNPDSLHYIFHMAKQHHTSRNYEQALAYFKSAEKLLSPKHNKLATSVYSYIASINCTLGRCKEALDALDQAEKRGIKHPEISYNKGRTLLIMGRYEEALDCFKEAINVKQRAKWGDLSVCDYKADWGTSAALLGLKKFDKAIEKARQVLEKNPDYHPAHMVLIQAYLATGQLDALGSLLLSMRKFDQNTLNTAHRVIAAYESQGRISEVRDICRHIVECGHDSADIRFKLGVCAESQGELPDAEIHYKCAIELDDKCVEAYNNLALLYAQNGLVSEGLDMLSDAIDNRADYANTYFNAGDILYAIEQYSTAADMYQAGLLRCPDHAPGYFTLGNCYYQMSAFDAAVLAYKQALVLRPDYPEAANNLALIVKAA